ncbi:Abhydrolase superfamily domain containing protein [Pandoravirus celtis]|uniref:Abhydrolase superfamily domain containing protein n=1 Tax=Pandoravirus celtis TaxID=2568002 RepID=A0A4D6EJQ0_9VIRU|nr:Abhydrolase superfamily domain containing protein [Pandoravirus celtis]
MAPTNVAGCLLLLLAIAATTTFAVDALPRFDTPNASPGCPGGRTVVSTRYGRLQGKRIDGVVQYLGVPFAAPPVGALRLAPPVDPLPWRGVRNATAIGPVCPQSGSAYPVSEDCLYVDIYVPAWARPDSNLDVIVYYGGGAFRRSQKTDGSRLVERTGVLFVNPQHRLGLLGGLMGHESFLDDSGTYGNFGLMDIMQVLKWLRANIADFGGNPNSITLSGTSSGAIATQMLLTSPMAYGLFDRAVAISGGVAELGDRASMRNITGRVLAQLGCPDAGSAALDCLRAADASAFMPIQNALPEMSKPRPPVDGVVVVEHPMKRFREGNYQRVPTIISNAINESNSLQVRSYGFNATRQDYVSFVTSQYGAHRIADLDNLYPIGEWGTWYHVISAIDTDNLYVCTQDNIYQQMDYAGGSAAYRWLFVHTPTFAPPALGAYHTVEEAYFFDRGCFAGSFGFPPSCDQVPVPTMPAGPEHELGTAMMDLLTGFMRDGAYNPDFTWVPYGAATNYTSLIIDVEPHFALDDGTDVFRREACDWWQSVWVICGDGRCNPGETATSCPSDCAA